MTLEEYLKEMILKNYKSIRSFAEEIGLPYTTVTAMLKKGLRRSSVGNVERVVHGLGLKLSTLEQDGPENNLQLPDDHISWTEREHIMQYRALDKHGKKVINTLLALELERAENEPEMPLLQVAARSNADGDRQLCLRRDFDSMELEGEGTEF